MLQKVLKRTKIHKAILNGLIKKLIVNNHQHFTPAQWLIKITIYILYSTYLYVGNFSTPIYKKCN